MQPVSTRCGSKTVKLSKIHAQGPLRHIDSYARDLRRNMVGAARVLAKPPDAVGDIVKKQLRVIVGQHEMELGDDSMGHLV